MPINFIITAQPTTSESDPFSEKDFSISGEQIESREWVHRSQINTPTTIASKNKTLAIAAGAMVGKQAFNYVTSNVGKWTGDSRNQVIVNNISEAVGIGIMASQSLWLAAAYAGVRLGTTALNNWQEDLEDSKRVTQAYSRAGYRNYDEVKGRKH